VAGEVTKVEVDGPNNDNDSNNNNNNIQFQLFCGTCAPSDVERALARKALSGSGAGEEHNDNDKDGLSPSLSLTVPPIVWLLTVAEIEQATQQILKDTQQNLDDIAAVPLEDVTFDNTISKLMTPPNYKTNPQVAACKFLQHCHTDAAIREAASAAAKLLSASRVQGRMRKDVYERVKAYSESKETMIMLDSYRAHFVKAARQDFERAGLALPEAQAQQLKSLLEQDAAVCSNYGQNLGADTTKLYLTPAQLQGCSDDFIQSRLKLNAVGTTTAANDEEEGKCTITLKYPDIIPIGQTCKVAETRRLVLEAREGPNAYGNNLELVVQGITIRKQIASLLGYPSWAEYICTKRMSGSFKEVDDFLSNLHSKLRVQGQHDYDTLLQLKQDDDQEQQTGSDITCTNDNDNIKQELKLHAWDLAFYNNKLLKTKYGVDAEAIRHYFPLGHVVETTLEIYQELLGLTFCELPPGTFWSWFPAAEVRCFQVFDKSTSKSIGHFYLDLHPRSGKYGHAAIFHLVKRSHGDQGAVDCMLCNLPAGTAEKPSLLLHSNVVTFFHEFGHIMHGLCSEGVGNSTRLAKCPRDFVEAPSQMLENWVWQKQVLLRLSKHYETNQPLPDDMLQSMIRAKHVNVAFNSLRQIYLSRLDLSIHGPNPPKDVLELQQLVDTLRPAITLVDNPSGGCNMLRTFGHLMNQYSASYYGYMWAEVLSADMFATKFDGGGDGDDGHGHDDNNNVMNPIIGMEYRKYVLAPGGTHNITDHLTKFLGRPPNNEAFLKSRGILSSSSSDEGSK
jgi:thimet oligopeptidase